MFKKRSAPNKSVNLLQETNKISSNAPTSNPIVNNNNIEQQLIEEEQLLMKNQLINIQKKEDQQQLHKQQDIKEYLKQIRKNAVNLSSKDQQPNQLQPQEIQKQYIIIDQQEKNPKMGQMIIEDEQNNLQVVYDFGIQTPENSSDQIDFQEQIIKKTLTKANYNKLNKLSDFTNAKRKQKVDKYRKILSQINEQMIKSSINKQLDIKYRDLKIMQEEINYLSRKIEDKTLQIEQKKDVTIQLQNQLDKVKTIMEFIYYYGDEIQQFSKQGILKQAEGRIDLKQLAKEEEKYKEEMQLMEEQDDQIDIYQ